MNKRAPSLAELGIGEVPDISVLLACAEAAGCSASDIVNGRLNDEQVDAVRLKAKEMADGQSQ